MAFEEALESITIKAGADLSAATNQYKFVTLDANGNCILADALGEHVVGVLQNKPKQNQAATVAVDGVTKCQANAAIVAGANITTAATGRAVTAATGNQIVGQARSAAGAAGELFSLLLRPAGSSA